MDRIIDPDSEALEATADYAWKIGATIDKDNLRYVLEHFLGEYDATIENNQLDSDTVERRIVGRWVIDNAVAA